MNLVTLVVGESLKNSVIENRRVREEELTKQKKEMIMKEFVRTTHLVNPEVSKDMEAENKIHQDCFNPSIVAMQDGLKMNNARKSNVLERLEYDLDRKRKLVKELNSRIAEKSMINPHGFDKSNLSTVNKNTSEQYGSKITRGKKFQSISYNDVSPKSMHSQGSKSNFAMYCQNSVVKSKDNFNDSKTSFLKDEYKKNPQMLLSYMESIQNRIDKCDTEQVKEDYYKSSLEQLRQDRVSDIHVYQKRMRNIKKLTANVDYGLKNAVDIHWASKNMIKSTVTTQGCVKKHEYSKKTNDNNYLSELNIYKQKFTMENEVVHNDLAKTFAQADLKRETIESLKFQQDKADVEFDSCSLKLSEFNDLLNNIVQLSKVEKYLNRIVRDEDEIYKNLEGQGLFNKNPTNEFEPGSIKHLNYSRKRSYLMFDEDKSVKSLSKNFSSARMVHSLYKHQTNDNFINDSKTHIKRGSEMLSMYMKKPSKKIKEREHSSNSHNNEYQSKLNSSQEIKISNPNKLLSNIKSLKIKNADGQSSYHGSRAPTNKLSVNNQKGNSILNKLKDFEFRHPEGASEFIGDLIDVYQMIKTKNIQLQNVYSEGLNDLNSNKTRLKDLKAEFNEITAHQKSTKRLEMYYKNLDSKYVSDKKYSTSSGMLIRNNYPTNRISTKLIERHEIITSKQMQSRPKVEFDYHENKIDKKKFFAINGYGFLMDYVSKILNYIKLIMNFQDEMIKYKNPLVTEQVPFIHKIFAKLEYKYKKSHSLKFSNDETLYSTESAIQSPKSNSKSDQKNDIKNLHKDRHSNIDDDFIQLFLCLIDNYSLASSKDIALQNEALLTDKIIWLTLDKKTLSESILIFQQESNTDLFIYRLIDYYQSRSSECLLKKYDIVMKSMVDTFKLLKDYSTNIKKNFKERLETSNIIVKARINKFQSNDIVASETPSKNFSEGWKLAMQKRAATFENNPQLENFAIKLQQDLENEQRYAVNTDESDDDQTLDKVQDMLENYHPNRKVNNYRDIVDKKQALMEEERKKMAAKVQVNVKYLNDEEFLEYQRNVFKHVDETVNVVDTERNYENDPDEAPEEEMKSILYNLRSQDRIGVLNMIKEKNVVSITSLTNKFAEEKFSGGANTISQVLNKVKDREKANSQITADRTEKKVEQKSKASPRYTPMKNFRPDFTLDPIASQNNTERNKNGKFNDLNIKKSQYGKDYAKPKLQPIQTHRSFPSNPKNDNARYAVSQDLDDESPTRKFGGNLYQPHIDTIKRNIVMSNTAKFKKEDSNLNLEDYQKLDIRSDNRMSRFNLQNNAFYKQNQPISAILTKTSTEFHREKIQKFNLKIELVKSKTSRRNNHKKKQIPMITATSMYCRDKRTYDRSGRGINRSNNNKIFGMLNEDCFFRNEVNKGAEEFMPKIIDKAANLRF